MPENQKTISQYISTVITDSSTLKSKLKNNEYKISGFNINLEYSEFINALQELSKAVFTNCYFTITYSKSQNSNFDFKCEIIFDTCVFKEDFSLQNLSLINNIIFKYSIFENISFINLSAVNKFDNLKISVSECIVASGIEINIIYNQQLIIELIGDYTIYNEYPNIQLIICSNTNHSIQYENYKFNRNELLSYETYSITCLNCHFNVGIFLNNLVFRSTQFISCKFIEIADFSSSEIKSIDIVNTVFNNKLLIEEVEVEEIKLINCSFENTVKLVNIKSALINLIVERTTIKGMFVFNGFGDNKLITMANSSSIISFEHIFIENSGYLIIRKIRYGKFTFDYANILGQVVMQELDIDSLQMHNASIIGSLIVQDIKVKELDLKNTSLIGKLVFNPSDELDIFNSKPEIIKNRETAYLLKKGKQEEGDSISASHFKRMELSLYLNECLSAFYIWKKDKITDINKQIDTKIKEIYSPYKIHFERVFKLSKCILFLLSPFIYILIIPVTGIVGFSILMINWLKEKGILDKETIVLFFNKISNDFGQSWVRGIIFTMLSAFIFFMLINYFGLGDKKIFIIDGKFDNFGEVWKEYLKILNVLNFNDKLEGVSLTAWGETLFFVSKIFVSYGIYQTVSAFRKFGK